MSKSATETVADAAIREPTRAGQASGLLLGYVFAALGSLLFATKGIIIKLAYGEGMDAETLLALRMAFSLPFYLGVGLYAMREGAARAILQDRWLVLRAALVGLLGYWFASYTDFLGLEFITAQFERLILFTYPAFVVLFGALFFGQRVRITALLGIAVSYAGLALIFATNLSVLGADVAKGASLVLLSAVAFALYQLLAKVVIARMGPRLFTCVAMTAAAMAALLQFALIEPLSALLVPPKLMAYAVLLAVGATVLPSFLLSASLGRISAQANATIGMLSPVVTILLAVGMLGEAFAWADAAGTALVIAGIAWFTLAERR
jgi:drug/metabolite transporter (DMT)-like permease